MIKLWMTKLLYQNLVQRYLFLCVCGDFYVIMVEEESDPKYLLWWLYLVRNYPRQKTFEGQITLTHQQTIRKNMQPIKEAMLKIKPYVVSNNMSVVLRNNKC